MTTEIELAGKLNDVANQLAIEHKECVASVTAGLQHAIRAGKLLSDAKGWCEHGDWGKALAAICREADISDRTARGYMRVAGRVDELPAAENGSGVANLSFREALKLLSDAREQPAEQPESEPEPEKPTPCPDCGSTERDEDGDCASCYAPLGNSEPPADDEEGDAEDEGEDVGDIDEPDDEPEPAPDSPVWEFFSGKVKEPVLRYVQQEPTQTAMLAAFLRSLADEIEENA